MILLVFLEWHRLLRFRRVLWFLDNTVSLHSIIKGSAGHAALDRAIAVANFCTGWCKVTTWYEFVDSKGNWSDGISRELGKDPFIAKHGFSAEEFFIDPAWWTAELATVWRWVQDFLV